MTAENQSLPKELLQALETALGACFWFKAELIIFLRPRLPPGFPALDTPGNKKTLIRKVVAALNTGGRAVYPYLRQLVGEIQEVQDYPGLAWAPGKKKKLWEAQRAQRELTKQVRAFNQKPPVWGPEYPGYKEARTLGLSGPCSEEELKLRLRQLLKRHHPDLNPQDHEASHLRTQGILKAYETLDQLWFPPNNSL